MFLQWSSLCLCQIEKAVRQIPAPAARFLPRACCWNVKKSSVFTFAFDELQGAAAVPGLAADTKF
jgi:hypothetical protein